MKECKNCGVQEEDAAKFCPKCGGALTPVWGGGR